MDKRIESLKQRQVMLEDRLSRIRRDQTTARSADLDDQSQEQENDAVLDEIGASSKAELILISKALQRYENGNYGICQRCEQPIKPERLEAVPEAEYCLNCATY